MSLYQKALVMSYYLNASTLKKTDRQASEDLAREKGAEESAARVIKQLINPKYVKPVQSVINSVRAYLEAETLPWGRHEVLVPATKYFDVVENLAKFKDLLDMRLEIFGNNYLQAVEDAKKELAELFNPEDYPSVESIKSRFGFSVSFKPMTDVNQFVRLGFEDEETDKLKQAAIEHENELMKEAIESCYKRVHKHVSVLAKRLTDENTKRFRSALLENIETLINTLPGLNIYDDPELNEVLDDMREMVAGVTIEEIKKHKKVREEVAEQADAIVAKLEAFF